MQNIEKVDSYNTARDNYKTFGYYANSTRALASDVDGLKTVYRRMLWTAMQYPKGKFIKSAVISGECMKIHPHGEQSGVLYSLVNSKLQMFDKQGNFGSALIPGSAPRYTECRYNKIAELYLGQDLLNYCEMVEGDIGYMEPKYLPTLIPFILVDGNSSMGIGVSTSIPSLDIIDLIKYYKNGLTKNKSNIKINVGSCLVNSTKKSISDMIVKGKVSGVQYLLKPIIDGNNIIIKDLPPNMSFNRVYRIFSDDIEKDNIDYRDESNSSMRHVFEVLKGNINNYVDKLSSLSSTCTYELVFTGSYENSGRIVYSDLSSMRDKTLNYLRDCTLKKYAQEMRELERKIGILEIISYMKINNIIQLLPTLDKSELLKIIPFDKNLVEYALQQSISKLTKDSSDKELTLLKNKLDEVKRLYNTPEIYIEKLYDDLLKEVERYYINETTYISDNKFEKFIGITSDSKVSIIHSYNIDNIDNKSSFIYLDKLRIDVNYFMVSDDNLHGICIKGSEIESYKGKTIVDDTINSVHLTGDMVDFEVRQSESKWFMPGKKFNRKLKVFKNDIKHFKGGIL